VGVEAVGFLAHAVGVVHEHTHIEILQKNESAGRALPVCRDLGLVVLWG